jgi:hypothetical protein
LSCTRGSIESGFELDAGEIGWRLAGMSVEELVMRLPRLEKLRLMESLWTDLSRTGAEFESPAWHEVVLRETEQRLASGEEEMIDWEEAKLRLRV